MRRRLPLLGVASGGEHARSRLSEDAARVALGPHSVGVADTGSGHAAAEFALELAAAWARSGHPVTLVLLGYAGIPALPPGLSARRAHTASQGGAPLRVAAYGIDAAASPALPDGLSVASDEVTLWVGLPALCTFAPALALLLGADRPLLQWPEPLRARRPRCQLELGQLRSGLSAALAVALSEHGFLPRR